MAFPHFMLVHDVMVLCHVASFMLRCIEIRQEHGFVTCAQWAPGGRQVLLEAGLQREKHHVSRSDVLSQSWCSEAFFSGKVGVFDPASGQFVQDFVGHTDCVHSMKLVWQPSKTQSVGAQVASKGAVFNLVVIYCFQLFSYVFYKHPFHRSLVASQAITSDFGAPVPCTVACGRTLKDTSQMPKIQFCKRQKGAAAPVERCPN